MFKVRNSVHDGYNSTLGNPTNYGVYGWARNAGVGANIGVYGNVNVANSNGAGDWAGWFHGDVNITGTGVIPGGVWVPSDESIKVNVQEIINADSTLNLIDGFTYEFDNSLLPDLTLPEGPQIGVIAQKVQAILPELVKTIKYPALYDTSGILISDTFSILSVNYDGFIPLLIERGNNQSSEITSLQDQINKLQDQLNSCCSSQGMRSNDDGGNYNDQTIELENVQTNFLGQSVPNPHSSQCTIPYRIALTVMKAEIIFTDQLGSEISRVEIVTRGPGQLTVLSSQLEDGLYSYSLITDGKLIDTKKMVKQH